MPPKFMQTNKLEQLASSQEPSLEGSWWIMLQTAESIYNYAVEISRDPVSNKILSLFWDDISISVSKIINENSIRPLPYDDIMQLISYSCKQLESVIKNPRHSIIKVDKMVVPHRVKNVSSKGMNWLGKQPGKTIKEKLSTKNKMLTQVNEYTYDIKENQVAMVVYKQFMKYTKERMDYGINLKGYDLTDQGLDIINKIMKVKKLFRNTELSNVKPIYHTQPNNVLLADKNYSVLWKSYLEICKYDDRLSKKWDSALQMYVKAIYICINSIIASFNEVQVIEERINFSKDTGNNARYIISYKSVNPLILEVEIFNNKIVLDFYETYVDEIKNTNDIQKTNYNVVISEKIDTSKLKAKRGCPLEVAIISKELNEVIDIKADMSGIYNIVSYVIKLIEEKCGVKMQTKIQKSDSNLEGTCVFDISSNGKYFTVDNKRKDCFTSNKMALYFNEFGEKEIYKTVKDNDYSSANQFIFIKNAVNKDLKTEALKASLEEISKNVNLKMDDYFIYVVPDSLEEFSQKSLKQCVNAWFPRTFPVWRSVAALTQFITDKNNNIKNKDVFISIDLSGETATAGLLGVKYEKSVDTFVCNHYPPFPQNDIGDDITEEAFFRNYLKKYLDLHKLDMDNDTINNIIDEGKICDLFKEKSFINHSIVSKDSISIIKIEFDENILKLCKNDWINKFEEFWEEIKIFIPVKDIQYVNILSDSIIEYIDKDDIKKIVNSKKIFISSDKDISQGAFIYRDRLRGKNLPTWTEYLPKLSLEVIKEGHYEEIELIKDDVSFDVMGQCNEYRVPGEMLLVSGIKEFRFPLKKEDISKNAAVIEAYVTDKSFPLQENVKVELLVKYKYGFDNSYELVLKPIDGEKAPFDEIVVEWKSRDKIKVAKYPIYPELTNYDKVLKDISKVQKRFCSIEDTVERFIVKYSYDNVCRLDFRRLNNEMTSSIFTIRNIIVHDEIEEVQEFINKFYKSNLLKYLKEISGITSIGILNDFFNSEEFFNDAKATKNYKNLVCSAMQLIYSFGIKTPLNLQIDLLNRYETLDVVHKDNILLNMFFLNSNNKKIINLILEEFQNNDKKDSCIKELSSLCWFDRNMIYNLKQCPKFLEDIVIYITKELKYRSKNKPRREKLKSQQKRFLRYVEMILAILRLRELDDFSMLEVGSKESRELARYIRKVDEIMEHPKSKIKFKVNKPEALCNMSDVAYAVDMYLTGNEGVDSIEVISVESD